MQVWTVILEVDGRYADVNLFKTRNGAATYLKTTVGPAIEWALENRGETFQGVTVNGYTITLAHKVVL